MEVNKFSALFYSYDNILILYVASLYLPDAKHFTG